MKKIISLLVISLLLAFSACSTAGGLNDVVEENKVQREEDQSKSIEERQAETLSQTIQDGAYIEDVTYTVPSGEEILGITFQIKDDIVEKIEFKLGEEAHEFSIKHTTNSEAALQELLIGKNINDVEIPDKIAGSSLTTTAFKNYVEDLKIRY